MAEKEKETNEKKGNVLKMPSAHLSWFSLPDELREDININGSFTKFEKSKVEEPEMLEFEWIPAGISHATGYADIQQRFSSMCLYKEGAGD